ncbi:MAG: tetratricopeptide repeat protein [Nitrospiraceae bacterium]|nr:tetratricopeptide repeat protein [Nitrospiraceae bacterium]
MRYLLLSCMCVAVFLSYRDILTHDLVWDDTYEIYQNPWIRSTDFIPDILFSNSLAWNLSSAPPNYAPMKLLVRLIQYSLFETRAWGYHLTNLLFHLFSSVLVFLIAEVLFRNIYRAPGIMYPFASSLLFALHPVNTEAVNWASCLSELGMALFCLLAVYLYIRNDDVKIGTLIMTGVIYFCAILFKVTALFCLPLFFVYDFAVRRNIEDAASRSSSFAKRMFVRHIPLIVAAIGYLILWSYALGGLAPKRGKTALDMGGVLLNGIPLLTRYIRLLFWPVDLNALYVFHPVSSFSSEGFLASLPLALLFVSGAAIAARKDRAAAFALSVIALPLIPCLYLPAVGYSYYVFAERYLYLPSAGFAILAAAVAGKRVIENVPGKLTPTLLAAVLAGLLVVCSVLTRERSGVWKNDFTLWSDVVQKSPDSAIAHNNLGNAYERRGDVSSAIREYEAAVTINAGYVDAQNSLLELQRRGLKFRSDNALSR